MAEQLEKVVGVLEQGRKKPIWHGDIAVAATGKSANTRAAEMKQSVLRNRDKKEGGVRLQETDNSGSGVLAVMIPEVSLDVVYNVLPDAACVLASFGAEIRHVVIVFVRLAADVTGQEAATRRPTWL